MALGKYSRVDGSKKATSSYFSTAILVLFIALCLVGVWMLTSSSVVPVQNVDVSTLEAKDEAKERAGAISEKNANYENTESNTKQFEDNPGNLPEEATKGNNNAGSTQEDSTNTANTQKTSDDLEKANEKASEGRQEDKPVKDNSEEVKKSEDAPKTENENGNEESKTESKDSLAGEAKSDGNDEKKGDSETGEMKADGNDEKKVDSEAKETKTYGNDEKKGDSETGEIKADDEKKVDSEAKETKRDVNDEKNGDSEAGGVKAYDNDVKKADSEVNETKTDNNDENKGDSVESSHEGKYDSDKGEVKSDNGDETKGAVATIQKEQLKPELLNETTTQNSGWKTQASESKDEHEASAAAYKWKLCNVTAGPDYIPCLDNLDAIKHLRTTKHYEHRERHCPEDPPTCLVALPDGYQRPIKWPTSREKIWYHNVPHTKLAVVKGHQNWVKVSGNYLTFPGGGTQFKHGALHYIDFIQQSVPDISWGKKTRVILDVGCGVASFGGFLFDRDVLTMSLAPKDEHEAQVQFALERGIPAISAVMGTKRLPFPGRVFDAIHCARCRVPWHIEGGKLLLELNRVLRPGGFFIWSATPVYWKNQEDVQIWEAMKQLTKAMCWELVSKTKDNVNRVGIAIFHKPVTNECYEKRSRNGPPMCQNSDDPNAAWNVPLQACMHQIPVETKERGSQWPEQWSARLTKPPYWLLSTNLGVYGKPAPEDFTADYEHWKRVVHYSYLKGMGINWSTVRNVMDMKAIYGGLAAALRDLNIWVMNVVPLDSPDTLPVIYERGLFGIYHDWCESFNTYPRSYDLLHADHLFSKISKKCNVLGLVAETDRILRPEGKLIVRDHVDTISELESLFRSMHWDILLTYAKVGEGLLLVQKTMWRPTESETITYAID